MRPTTADELLGELGWVKALARGLVADPTLADDVAQDAYVLALERLPPGARGGASLRAWLAGATRKLAFGQRRSAARRSDRERASARSESSGSTHDVVARADLHQQLVAELMRLEEPLRSAILLRYLDGLSAPQIAERVGATPAAVRKRLSRGLGQLRTRLDARFGDRSSWLAALAHLAPLPAATSGTQVAAAGAVLASSKVLAWTLAAGVVGVAGFFVQRKLAPPEPSGSAQTVQHLAREESPAQHGPDAPASDAARVSTLDAPAAGKILVKGVLRHLPYPGVATPSDADVTIRARFAGVGPFEDGPNATTRTDAEGRFRVELDDSGKRPLKVSLAVDQDELYRYANASAEIGEGAVAARDMRIELAAHGTLMGRVIDPERRPVAGLQLALENEGPMGSGGGAISPSDADGRFSIASFQGTGLASGPLVRSTSARWSILRCGAPKRIDSGGWEPIEVVASRSGALVLRCVDPDGRPVQVDVSARVAASEPEGRASSFQRAIVSAKTGESGIANLDAVWAQRRLRLTLASASGSVETERMSDGRLVLGEDAVQVAPIVVPAESTLELTVVFAPSLTIRGRVLHPDGRAAAQAYVYLRGLDGSGTAKPSADVRADDEGRFDWTSDVPVDAERLRIFAADVEATRPFDASWVQATPPVGMLAETVVELGAGAAAEREIELTLQPVLELSGRVVDAEGQPVETILRAVPEGCSLAGFGSTVRCQATRSAEDGAFAIGNLLPGRYELIADVPGNGFFTSSLVRQRRGPFDAGTGAVELVLDASGSVRIRVRALAPAGREVATLGVALCKLHPLDASGFRAPTPGRKEHVRDTSGWPPQATLALGGGQAFSRCELGFLEGCYMGSKGASFESPPLEEGCYWLGVRAVDAAGRPFHPTGLGPIFLGAGEYDLAFDIAPSADLRGIVTGCAQDAELQLALVDGPGELVQFRAGEHAATRSPVGSGGRFELQGLPAGKFTLWIGTPEELVAGRPRLAQPIEIRAGENSPLEIAVR